MEVEYDNADGSWSYFGNAAAWNTASKWNSTPNLNPSDTKVLQGFAHGNVTLDRSRGVVRDDNMKFRIARIAVALFGSPLSLQKFQQVDVRWNTGSGNVFSNIVTSALNPVNAVKDTASIVKQNAPIVTRQIGEGIAKAGQVESDIMKNYVSKLGPVGQLISKVPNYGDLISNVGTKLNQYDVHTTPQPSPTDLTDTEKQLVATLPPDMKAAYDKLSPQDKKDFIAQYKATVDQHTTDAGLPTVDKSTSGSPFAADIGGINIFKNMTPTQTGLFALGALAVVALIIYIANR